MNELIQEELFCEICEEDPKLGVSWSDGESRNSLCYECIDRIRSASNAEGDSK